MMMIEDRQLLAEYLNSRSDSAFGELVNRHIDLVFSAALRMAQNDCHLAEDVTQTVFADLARKAPQLPANVVLPGWLYRHACFTASKAIRTERRRQAREQIAIEMNALENQPEAGWDQIAPELEEAMNSLSDTDRDALVLRFFQRRDFRAVGATLGISEDAAQKRVTRALEKLRAVLGERGVALTAATLGTVLVAEAVTAAPAGLAAAVTTSALAAAVTGTATAFSAFKLMSVTKLQWALVAGLAIAAVSIPLVQSNRINRVRQENDALRRQTNDLAGVIAENQRLAKLRADADELARLRKERADLPRLRGEVTSLRNRNRELAASASSNAASHPPVGPFIPAAQFNDVGLGTPEAALQTFLWALLNTNEARAKEATDYGPMKKMLKDMVKDFNQDADFNDTNFNLSLNDIKSEPEKFAGFQVISVQSNSIDQMELDAAVTRTDGSEDTKRVTLNRIDDEWKVDLLSLADTNGVDGHYSEYQPDGSQTTNNMKFKVQQTKQAKLVPDD